MSYEIEATDFNGKGNRVNIDEHAPDFCPICNRHVNPLHQGSYLNGEGVNSPWLQRVYKCTNSRCGKIFLALYRGVPQGRSGGCWYFYHRVEPGYPQNPSIPTNVAELLKNFSEIYKQASYAESYGLNEICGVGYRKALEFLVKDFLVTKSEELGVDKETIIKTTLYNCIIKYHCCPVNNLMKSSSLKLERASKCNFDEEARPFVDAFPGLHDLPNITQKSNNFNWLSSCFGVTRAWV